MKITIELDDLISNFVQETPCGEYGIEDQFVLKDEIKKAIISQVAYKNFSAEIKSMREKAEEALRERISEKMDEIIEKHIERIIRTDKVKFGNEKEPITLSEYISKVYMDTSYEP